LAFKGVVGGIRFRLSVSSAAVGVVEHPKLLSDLGANTITTEIVAKEVLRLYDVDPRLVCWGSMYPFRRPAVLAVVTLPGFLLDVVHLRRGGMGSGGVGLALHGLCVL
jgi:hypothetical protein